MEKELQKIVALAEKRERDEEQKKVIAGIIMLPIFVILVGFVVVVISA